MTTDVKLAFNTAMALTEAIDVEEVDIPKLGADLTTHGASRFTVPVGACTPAHSHAPPEVWFIRSGCGILTVDGTGFEVKGGDIVYLQSEKMHAIANVGKSELQIFSMWWS